MIAGGLPAESCSERAIDRASKTSEQWRRATSQLSRPSSELAERRRNKSSDLSGGQIIIS